MELHVNSIIQRINHVILYIFNNQNGDTLYCYYNNIILSNIPIFNHEYEKQIHRLSGMPNVITMQIRMDICECRI